LSDLPAWIQAAAAVVQAGAAVTIYVVTKDYVKLTRDIARAGTDQLKFSRLSQLAEDKQRAVALNGRASSLEARVTALPSEITGPADRLLRQAALWTPAEIDALQTAASGVLSLAAEAASRAAIDLSWLLDRILEIRAVPPQNGYDYSRFPKEEWQSRRADALLHLRELMAYAKSSQELVEDFAKQTSQGVPALRDKQAG
jgi:hypothetical protein